VDPELSERRLQRVGHLLTSAAFGLLLASLAWAPLPLGSNRPWAWSLLALLGASCLLLWSTGLLLTGEKVRVPWPVGFAAATTACVAVWGFLQGTPGILPEEWAHPIWREVAETGLTVRPTVAISPEATRDSVMRLLGYAAFFALGFLAGRDSARARRLFGFLFVVGAVYAVYGLVLHFGRLGFVVPGFDRPYDGRLHASFVNPNNYATYANLGILLGLGLLVERLTQATDTGHLRRLVLGLLDELCGKRSFLVLGLLLIVTASLLTASRGGFLSLSGALALMGLLLFLRVRPRLRTTLITFGAIAVAGWGLLALSGATTLERLDQLDTGADLGPGGRIAAYALALEMAERRPWLGHGYGSFEQVFLMHRDERFPLVFDKAHNTYLEHLVELGLPATALLWLGPLVLAGHLVAGVFRRRRHQIFPLVGAAAAALVGLHALVDFSLQIPAVAVTFAAMFGVAAAQAERSVGRAKSPVGRSASRPAEMEPVPA
jgi:O-antigen ligase